jgi:hypothetical protein
VGRPSRETILTALFNKLVASVATNFAADTQANSVALVNPSTTACLFVGLPVFGAGVPRGAVITNLSPLTISQAATANALQVPMTTGFLTFSRRFKHWSDVTEQPALFLRDTDEQIEYINTVMQRQIIKAEIWIYSNAGQDPDAVPGTALNNLLDAVQCAFAPDQPGTGMFTLGGLVNWCRLAGKIEKEPGDIGGQAIAVADVEIIVP